MIYEIRNYHYEPSRMIEYKAWAADKALPYIREHFDLLGFWVSTDDPAEVNGKPLDELGSARSLGFSAGQTSPPATSSSPSCSAPTNGKPSWPTTPALRTTTAWRPSSLRRCSCLQSHPHS